MSKTLALATMAHMLGGLDYPTHKNKTNINDIDFTPKIPPTPKGCIVYHFDEYGNCLYDNNHTSVFKCIAINEKSATKKFNKWCKSLLV